MAKKKKGFLDKMVDAVTNRDEKEAAEAAKEAEKKAAEAKRAREEAHKRTAEIKAKNIEARAEAAEERAKAAEAKAKAAEKAAAEIKAESVRLAWERKKEERAEAKAEAKERAEAKAKERAEAKSRVYVVKSGDSLSKIAKEVLGDASRWPEIFEANKDKIKDPNMIHPGQELRIP